MEKIYNKVKHNSNFKAFVYFSDHGEGIEGNLMHDINRYTSQMAKIPFVMIFSNKYLHKRKNIPLKAVSQYYFTNDLIFNAMVDVMNIDLGMLKEEENSIFNSKYNNDFTRFRTTYGKRPIEK